MAMTRVVVHIDTLVLTGIDRHDAAAVSAGVQAELQRRLALPGAAVSLAEGGDRHRIRAGAVPVAPGSGARGIGHAVAAGIVPGGKS
ncbi:hypothetical protein [Denitromonas iodatirespirans]|uniref:Uncharacterized protein n=1 Tax=Denitromonas iodatirespirans TaxID=2795389 RepID=A0A944H680_DENI1|nr:hypothetical protein [Denitromonas iodatirespirans]MBT0959888.1 hypothetical protein [Denitromonas iodatirespirans]